MNKMLIVSLIFSLALASGGLASSINQCAILNSAGEYDLNTSFTNTTYSVGRCLNILSGDIIIDCKGFTIEGDSHNGNPLVAIGSTVSTTFSNITIRNCNLTNWYKVILPYNWNNVLISNNTFFYGYYSLNFGDIANSFIIENNNFSEMFDFITSETGIISNLVFKNNNIYFYSEGYNAITITGTCTCDNCMMYNNYFDNNMNWDLGGNITLKLNTTKQTGDRIYSNGTQIGGNYWVGFSDVCTDSNNDGFCDNSINQTTSFDYLPYSINFIPPYVSPYLNYSSHYQCLDNSTLQILNFKSINGQTFNLTELKYCENGCDNATLSCSPMQSVKDFTTLSIIGFLIIIGIIVIKKLA
jgi:hypothetical protein